MSAQLKRLPAINVVLFVAFLASSGIATAHETATTLLLVTVMLVLTCLASAAHLFGVRPALHFFGIAIVSGWLAEVLGSRFGLFFGDYQFTEALGIQLAGVPIVIPMMWFNLTYVCFVLSNLLVWRAPIAGSRRIVDAVLLSFLAAMLVTAYDLGMDPYMVFVVKAWVMKKPDGWWFGETLQGFVGWLVVSFGILVAFRISIRNIDVRPAAPFRKIHALIPVSIYGCWTSFMMMKGQPVETRTIVAFAMGIPLLCTFMGWSQWRWDPTEGEAPPLPRAPEAKSPAREASVDALLDRMQMESDALADEAVDAIVGSWDVDDAAGTALSLETCKPKLASLEEALRLLRSARNNEGLSRVAEAEAGDARVREAIAAFVARGRVLPEWADPAKIRRAEALFAENGVLVSVILFFASLPEVYVRPDISTLLHSTGNLERSTENRIRTTATMVLTSLLAGGLGAPEGGGVFHVLKARFVHAMSRNLVLRGSPVVRAGEGRHVARLALSPTSRASHGVFEALLANGWDLENGLPINQEEMAYTLLSFSYVFLRSLRRLGLGFSRADEEAYLHCWNVIGHTLGLRRELMAQDVDEAEVLFTRMQARARARVGAHDPRPALASALLKAGENAVSPMLRPVVRLVAGHLCDPSTTRDLRLHEGVSLVARVAFALGMGAAEVVDRAVGLVHPHFSTRRFLVRIIGYQLLARVFTDGLQRLDLPPRLLAQVHGALDHWSQDREAPRWVNQLEDRFTASGSWQEAFGIPRMAPHGAQESNQLCEES